MGTEGPVSRLKGCGGAGWCRVPSVKAGACLGWAVGLGVLLPDAMGGTRVSSDGLWGTEQAVPPCHSGEAQGGA